jgi:hypothetical protein
LTRDDRAKSSAALRRGESDSVDVRQDVSGTQACAGGRPGRVDPGDGGGLGEAPNDGLSGKLLRFTVRALETEAKPCVASTLRRTLAA